MTNDALFFSKKRIKYVLNTDLAACIFLREDFFAGKTWTPYVEYML